MAKKVGFPEQFYIGGYDLSGDVGSLERCSSPVAMFDVTAIDKSAVERLQGLADGQIAFNTWFNDVASQEHVALKGLVTTDRPVLWALGSARGDVAAMLVAKQMDYAFNRGEDGSLALSSECLGASGVALEYGEMITAGKITHASAASSASYDNGASSANGLAAMLQLVSLATGTVTVAVHESSDDGVGDPFAAKATFTAVAAASAPTSERITATGTVERYLRITTTGTFTTAVFAVGVRRGTAQDRVAY